MTTEIIAMIANLSLALSFIIALIFGIGQVRAAERDRKDRFTLETLRNFDEILVLHKGRVEKIGSPAEVLKIY